MPLALLGLLWLGATCGQRAALEASTADGGALRLACERALASLAGETVALPPSAGPALRALRGTGRGARVDALEASLTAAAQRALADVSPWLLDAASRLPVEPGAEEEAPAAFRAAHEDTVRAELAAAVDRALGPAGAQEALAAVRTDAANLPLPRDVDLDLVSYVTHWAAEGFFAALSVEARRLREARALVQDGRAAEQAPRNQEEPR
jgi:hypothetical protein